ncbi:MAG TPA: hypothetical protein DCR17_03315 [Verrucomicrobiales bacterium]|nr:hypothetical protein [Verrucomicrobiales bacterium]|tara:strand:- start:3664 stop:3852 length:189 start_codon:yes stop_codon:yes gene_type:complete
MLQKPINFIHELSAIGRFLRKIAMRLEREVILEEKKINSRLGSKSSRRATSIGHSMAMPKPL